MDIKDIATGMELRAIRTNQYIITGKTYRVVNVDGNDVRIEGEGGTWWVFPTDFEPLPANGWESL